MTIASVLLTTAMWATAQQPTEPATATVDRRAMAEHIEVFRQVLRRRLARAASSSRASAGQYVNYADAASVAQHLGSFTDSRSYNVNAPGSEPDVEGVYLPGYGVVFTATLPTAWRDARPRDDQPAAKTLSEWARAQMELRGLKAEPADFVENRPPSIRDVLLRMLADNGRHLTHLGGSERVSIVVTFRDSAGPWAPLTPLARSGAIYLAPSLRSAVAPTNGPLLSSAPAPASGAMPTTARDYELLADLHLKQQQYQARTVAPGAGQDRRRQGGAQQVRGSRRDQASGRDAGTAIGTTAGSTHRFRNQAATRPARRGAIVIR